MSPLFTLFSRPPRPPPIVIVSGLPRSGTSLMMKILEAGGVRVLTDHTRKADTDNPHGYYEFERVKRLPDGDIDWLLEAEGKAVKIISALLGYLPAHYSYKIIFMQRAIPEVLASQRIMLARLGRTDDHTTDEAMQRLLTKHVREVRDWMERQGNIDRLDVPYAGLISTPTHAIMQIAQFLGRNMDMDRMATVIDPSLYRNCLSK